MKILLFSQNVCLNILMFRHACGFHHSAAAAAAPLVYRTAGRVQADAEALQEDEEEGFVIT